MLAEHQSRHGIDPECLDAARDTMFLPVYCAAARRGAAPN
jgi:hypothetical protein